MIFCKVSRHHWGWLATGEQRMHLVTLDAYSRYGPAKALVWLEDRGRRVFEPALLGKTSAIRWRKLQATVEAERELLEAHWIKHMMEKAWLRADLKGSIVTLTAYPDSANDFTRTIDLRRVIAGAYPQWDDEPPEVDFHLERGLMRVGDEGEDVDRRHHVELSKIVFLP